MESALVFLKDFIFSTYDVIARFRPWFARLTLICCFDFLPRSRFAPNMLRYSQDLLRFRLVVSMVGFSMFV
jgi:hypothetical protein